MLTLRAGDAAYSLNAIRCGRPHAPLVVLVHAIGLDLTYWGEQIEALGTAYDVVAYDLLGHGNSSGPLTGYSFEAMARDLASVIQQANAGPAHVVGLSVGGMIAQTCCIQTPELIRSLSLIDTVATLAEPVRAAIRQRAELTRHGGMEAIMEQTLERWFTPEFAARRPDVLDRVSKTLLTNSKDIHGSIWDTISTLDVASLLTGIERPTLVVVGECDPTTPVAASRLIAQAIKGARLEIVPAASHISTLEAPKAVNKLLLEFLAEY